MLEDELLTDLQLAFNSRDMDRAWDLWDSSVPDDYVVQVPSGHRLHGANVLHIAVLSLPDWRASQAGGEIASRVRLCSGNYCAEPSNLFCWPGFSARRKLPSSSDIELATGFLRAASQGRLPQASRVPDAASAPRWLRHLYKSVCLKAGSQRHCCLGSVFGDAG